MYSHSQPQSHHNLGFDFHAGYPPPACAASARRSQVALLGKASKSTTVKEIATMGANLVVASKSDTMQDCMAKMVARDIRHLPVVDEDQGQVCELHVGWGLRRVRAW